MLPHFRQVVEGCAIRGWDDGHQTLTVDRAGFARMLQGLLARLPFDEAWYLDAYPDVRKAIEEGELKSARHHYVQFGYFEGRLPGLTGFDERAYLARYPDLEALLGRPDARQAAIDHFVRHGYREGRNPQRDLG